MITTFVPSSFRLVCFRYENRPAMKIFVWLLVVVLVLLHQDYWQWNDTVLLTGFLPRSLAYHAGISLAAAFVWALAVKFCWPHEVDRASAAPGEGGVDR